MSNVVVVTREQMRARALDQFGVCETRGCGRVAVCEGFCYDCTDQIEALRQWKLRKEQRRAKWLGVLRELEWIGPLVFVSCGLAAFFFEEREFIHACFQMAGNVWGK